MDGVMIWRHRIDDVMPLQLCVNLPLAELRLVVRAFSQWAAQMTTTTIDLERLCRTVDFLGAAAVLLERMDRNESGFEYILEKVREDIAFIVDPVCELIDRQRRGRRRRVTV
jgi:hypothetical protein